MKIYTGNTGNISRIDRIFGYSVVIVSGVWRGGPTTWSLQVVIMVSSDQSSSTLCPVDFLFCLGWCRRRRRVWGEIKET